MAFALASAGFAVFQGLEQQKAGKAAKKQADLAAQEERTRAIAEAGIVAEEQHDILVEGRFEEGALKAIGGKAGIGAGGSFGTLINRVRSQTRRKMSLLQRRTSESMRQREFSAQQFEREGRTAFRTARQQSYLSFMQAGLTLGRAHGKNVRSKRGFSWWR